MKFRYVSYDAYNVLKIEVPVNIFIHRSCFWLQNKRYKLVLETNSALSSLFSPFSFLFSEPVSFQYFQTCIRCVRGINMYAFARLTVCVRARVCVCGCIKMHINDRNFEITSSASAVVRCIAIRYKRL